MYCKVLGVTRQAFYDYLKRKNRPWKYQYIANDHVKRNFYSEEPLTKCVTDISELKASDGKLYVSAIFDCFDVAVLGLALDTNMKATLVEKTLDNAYISFPGIRGAIVHSDL